MEKISKKLDFLEVQKFAYMERLLLWRGQVKRRDLIEKFALSESSAAITFRTYLEVKPGGLVLDRSVKAYTPPAGFTPAFYEPDLAHCELPVLKSGLKVTIPKQTLIALAESIRDKKTLMIEYLSIQGEKTKREIAPLSMIRMVEGFPEALCAWCFLRSAIRTFQIPLIQKISVKRAIPSEVSKIKLELGRVSYSGADLIIPRESIYAVASQIVSVPELRDEVANEVVRKFAAKLEAAWKPIVC